MKKLFYISITLFTFLSGVFVFYIRPLFMPIHLIELKGKLEQYKNHRIKVKGYFTLAKGELSYLYNFEDYMKKCDSKDVNDCWVIVPLEFPNEIETRESLLTKEIVEKNLELLRTTSREGKYGAEVEIIGYVEEEYVPALHDSFLKIRVEVMNQISPVAINPIAEETDTK